MAIRQSVDDLPAAQRQQGLTPSRNPFVVTMLAVAWHRQYIAERGGEYAPAIPGRRYRASNVAFRCDRQQYYALTNTERSDPDTIADDWRMGLGSLVHTALQNVLDNFGFGWRHEVIVDLAKVGVDGSAHADLVQFVCVHCDATIGFLEVVDSDSTGWEQHAMQCSARCDASTSFEIERKSSGAHTWAPEHERAEHVVELKTINGFSFKVTATTFKGPPEGPRSAHILQGGMAADALGCDKLIIGYLSMENVSASLAEAYDTSEIGKFAAEWHFLVSDLRPHLDAEYARIRRLMSCVDAQLLPDRQLVDTEVPPGSIVVDPMKGRWQLTVNGVVTDTGTKWFCGYCGWRQQCITDGTGAEGEAVEL